MKSHYDKGAVDRQFLPGEKVLLFLPLRKFALQAKYQGPFEVLEKKSDVNYVIATPERRKDKRLVHVNLLKEYIDRDNQGVGLLVAPVKELCNSEITGIDLREPGVKLNNSNVLYDPTIKTSHLLQEQRLDIHCLLGEFEDLFADVPRRCSLVTHDVALVDGARPVKQSPYRVPREKRRILRDEVEFLTLHGLVEPSKSEWASPCVLVPKPDGSMRMCTDYRHVNALTRADSFPLPRIDDIIDAIGDATLQPHSKG